MNNLLSASLQEKNRIPLPQNNQSLVDVQLVKLDNVVQEVFKRDQKKIQEISAVIRCDALPVVEGSAIDYFNLFSNLINLILAHASIDNKLFIHIKCDSEKLDIMDLSLKQDYKNFQICFHTNCSASNVWLQDYHSELKECTAICQRNNGSFKVVAADKFTGCLFELKFPGKLN